MKSDPLDEKIHALLDGVISPEALAALEEELRANPEARRRYLRSAAVHAGLVQQASGSIPSFLTEAPASPAPTPFPKKPLLIALAACIALAAGAFFSFPRDPEPRAKITSALDVRSPAGSQTPAAGALEAHQAIELLGGWIEIAFPSGASVAIEGPCRFELQAPESLTIFHGRAAVNVPPGAEGFRLDTPGGQIVDLGTAFGVAVGNDGSHPVVLAEVFDGEIEIHAGDRSPARLRGGEARAIVRDRGELQLVSTLDESPVHVSRPASPAPSDRASGENLALGKPVFSPGYCVRPHGSVFPPDNVTDGRTDDSGVPNDWSFWLAPDGKSGEFTVDLIDPAIISRISLQNTANRGIGDRGTARFLLLGSLDNHDFKPLLEADLPPIVPGESYPFHDFHFDATRVRFVKFVVLEHLRHPERPVDHPIQGGGLNEIRIFEN